MTTPLRLGTRSSALALTQSGQIATALRDGGRSWLWVGLVAGLGLQNKPLVAVLLAALLAGVLLAGPREVLRTPDRGRRRAHGPR